MALMSLHRDRLDPLVVEQTLGCVLKVHEDTAVVNAHQAELAAVVTGAPGASASGGYTLENDFGAGSVSANRG
jgi:hypothetical protein